MTKALIEALDSSEWEIVKSAAVILGRRGDDGADVSRHLKQVSGHIHPEVRLAVMAALQQMHPSRLRTENGDRSTISIPQLLQSWSSFGKESQSLDFKAA